MHLFDQHLRLFFVRLKLHSRPIVQYIVVIFIQNISDLVRKFLVLINDLLILFFKNTYVVLEPLPYGGTTIYYLTGPNFLAFALRNVIPTPV